jgi:hypothetical protein
MVSKKGQSIGLINGIVFGIAGLIIAAIIAFTIVSTLTGAELLTESRTSSTTTNETGGYINTTGYTLTNFDSDTTKAVSITEVANASGLIIAYGNYTLDSSTGTITNASTTTWDDINITYVITTESVEEASSDSLAGNFTEGVDNVSDKIPTVLLVAAIVLILGVMAILVGVWQRMRLGQGGSL